MKNVGRIVTALAVVVSILGPGAQQSAFADDAVMYVSGSGTITPGLSTTPTAQTVTFCGTGTVAAGDHAGTYNFCFNGTDPAGTTASGSGSGTLSGDITGNISFSRTGIVATMTGNVTYGSTSGSIQSAVCFWVYTSVNPTTSETWVCVWVIAH